ncbi:MAG: S24 family peptidase [Burkholderiaceae bacterium]|nr:S24 family peptidase [Burkholderiaceae bacterium]
MNIDVAGPVLHSVGSCTEQSSQQLRISRTSYAEHMADAGYSANDHEFSAVPELDVRLAAGKLGIENYTESQIGEMQLRTSFLESFGLHVERMRIVYGDGDSMEPVIRNRAPMLFYHEPVMDRSQINLHTIYAINQGGRMLVKCIAKSGTDGWVMRSLNPIYPDAPLCDDDGRDVCILGRILWSPYDLRNGVDKRLVAR